MYQLRVGKRTIKLRLIRNVTNNVQLMVNLHANSD